MADLALYFEVGPKPTIKVNITTKQALFNFIDRVNFIESIIIEISQLFFEFLQVYCLLFHPNIYHPLYFLIVFIIFIGFAVVRFKQRRSRKIYYLTGNSILSFL